MLKSARILRVSAGETSFPPPPAREGERDGPTPRLARQTESDPIIAACLHNDTPFRSGREDWREGGRERAPKINQTGRDGIRGPPGATADGFTPVHRPSAEVQIAPPSGLHPANGKPPRRPEGGGAAALTLCYDKYIFLFVLLIRPRAGDTRPGACHRPAPWIDGERTAGVLFANANAMNAPPRRSCLLISIAKMSTNL